MKHAVISEKSLRRHADAAGLREKRSRNIRRALERIIEKADANLPAATERVRKSFRMDKG